MGYKFNPFSGNFDQTGSGGGASYIDGEEATYNDLSLDAGVAPLNSAWLVRNSSGIWPFNKPGGIYIRTATGGSSRDADYTYAGTMPDVFSDAVLTIYDEASTTRAGQFNLGSVTAGQNRVLTWPNANGTIARTEDFASPPAIGNTTRNTGAFTTIGATGIITGANATTSPPTTIDQARGLQFASLNGTFGNTAAIYGSYPSTATLGIGIQNNSAGIITQVAAFTSSGLSVNGGTVTASAPVLDLAQTWNNSGVTFTGMQFNVTNTASNSASNVIDIKVGGTTIMMLKRSGTLHLGPFTNSGFYTPAPAWHGSSAGLMCATNLAVGSSLDTILERGGAGILEQRNAANPQTFRLYNTFTDANNHERGFMRWSSNVFQLGTEKGSGGGLARALEFQTDGVTRMTVGATGNAGIGASPSTLEKLTISQTAGFQHRAIRVVSGTETAGGFVRLGMFGNISNAAIAAFGLNLSSDSAGNSNRDDATKSGWSFVFDNRASTDQFRINYFNGTDILPFQLSNLGRATFQFNGNISTGDARLNVYTDSSTVVGQIIRGAASQTANLLECQNSGSTVLASISSAGAGSLVGLTLTGNLTISTKDIVTDTTTGTKIGTATNQKIGFFNATPVDRPDDVSMSWDLNGEQGDIADAQDIDARKAIIEIRARLRELGLMATT